MAKIIKPFRENWPLLETNLFGANPANYARYGLSGHDGLDYIVPTGTDIIAPMEGKTYVGWDEKGWGLYIAIDNSWGWCVVCHLKDNLVATGTTVSQGQLIAHSDNTGNSSGPHVHLGLKVKGVTNAPMKNFVDPLPYLKEQEDSLQAEYDKCQEERNRNWTWFAGLCEIMQVANNYDVASKELKKLIEYEDLVIQKDKQINEANVNISELSEQLKVLSENYGKVETENNELLKKVEDQAKTIDKSTSELETAQKDLQQIKDQLTHPVFIGWKKLIYDLLMKL